MKKKAKTIIAVLTMFAMMISLCNCGKTVEAADTFDGQLIDAQNERLVVKGEDETMLFVTSENTAYNLGEEKSLCVDDQVKITYHKNEDDGMCIAESVTVTQHMDESSVFGGEVTELEDGCVTVHSESLSVSFDYDKGTKLEGNLSEGDAVTVTYDGDISENPYAKSIVVIQEKKEEPLKTVHGTISETSNKSVLVSMDSSGAARFEVNPETVINGDDSIVKVGDEVNLVYKGNIGEAPVAAVITVKRNTKQQYFVMDGIIDKHSSKELIVKTAKKSYVFEIRNNTRIQNRDLMKSGNKCTITYVGKLDEKPVAASIYCSKKKVTEKEKKSADKIKKDKEKKKSSDKKKTDKKAESDASKKTADNTVKENTDTAKKTEPAPSAEKKEEPAAETPAEPSKSTETPAADETQPTTEEKTEPVTEDTTPPTTEEKTEPVTDDTTPPTTEEKTEPVVDGSDENKENPDETVDDLPPEPEAPEVLMVKAKGEIEKWENPCVIKIDGGATLNLDITNATLSGGYIPKKDDEVEITYDKNTMKLISVELKYRPVDIDAGNDQKADSTKAEEIKTNETKPEAPAPDDKKSGDTDKGQTDIVQPEEAEKQESTTHRLEH